MDRLSGLLKLQADMDQFDAELRRYDSDIERIGLDGISQPNDIYIVRLLCKMRTNRQRLERMLAEETSS